MVSLSLRVQMLNSSLASFTGVSLFILVCHFPWGTVKGRSKKAEQEATDLVLLHPVEEVTGHDLHRVRRGTITRRAEMHHAAMSDNPSPLGRKCSGVEN